MGSHLLRIAFEDTVYCELNSLNFSLISGSQAEHQLESDAQNVSLHSPEAGHICPEQEKRLKVQS